MAIADLKNEIQGGWEVTAKSPEHPDERKHRIIRQYIIMAACFAASGILLYVTYNPPSIDGVKSKDIQEAAFHAFIIFFTGCISWVVGKQSK